MPEVLPFRCLQCIDEGVNAGMGIRFVIGTDIYDIAFQNQCGYITIDLLYLVQLPDQSHMPAAAREGFVHYDTVYFIFFDVIDKSFHFRCRIDAFTGFVMPI